MIFTYKAFTKEGEETKGTAEAFSVDAAISQLQKRGLVISEIHAPNEKRLKISLPEKTKDKRTCWKCKIEYPLTND